MRLLAAGPVVLIASYLAGACTTTETSRTQFRLGVPPDSAAIVLLGTGHEEDTADLFGYPRAATSLAVILPDQQLFVIDPGPQVLEQLTLLAGGSGVQLGGILLTGVDDDVVAGLARLAALRGARLPLHATAAQVDLLLGNKSLRGSGGLSAFDLRTIPADGTASPVSLGDGVQARPIGVGGPRDEVAAWRLDGRHRSILYMPRSGPVASVRSRLDELFGATHLAVLDGRRLGEESPSPAGDTVRPPSAEALRALLDDVKAPPVNVRFTNLAGDDPARHRVARDRATELAVDGMREWF